MTREMALLSGNGFNLSDEDAIRSPFWYVQHRGSEHGPLTLEEVERIFLGSQKLSGPIHLWRPGLAYWISIDRNAQDPAGPKQVIRNQIVEYEREQRRSLSARASMILLSEDTRRHQRHHLVASVHIVSGPGKREFVGVCIDLSVQGIKIRLDGHESELGVGERVCLEILPISLSGLRPFRVAGEVRWSAKGERGLELYDSAGAAWALSELERFRNS